MKKSTRWWLYFGTACLAMICVNLATLFDSWNAYYLDGSRRVGWPAPFYWVSVWNQRIDLKWIVVDLGVAVGISKVFADASVAGYRVYLRWLAKWGIPDA